MENLLHLQITQDLQRPKCLLGRLPGRCGKAVQPPRRQRLEKTVLKHMILESNSKAGAYR